MNEPRFTSILFVIAMVVVTVLAIATVSEGMRFSAGSFAVGAMTSALLLFLSIVFFLTRR